MADYMNLIENDITPMRDFFVDLCSVPAGRTFMRAAWDRTSDKLVVTDGVYLATKNFENNQRLVIDIDTGHVLKLPKFQQVSPNYPILGSMSARELRDRLTKYVDNGMGDAVMMIRDADGQVEILDNINVEVDNDPSEPRVVIWLNAD